MKIARVFPTKTSMSPTDPLAFFGPPTLEAIAAEPDEVHISVTFTWDLEKADELFYQWEMLGVPVEVGGPAFGDRMSDTFTPGLYLATHILQRLYQCSNGKNAALCFLAGWNRST